MFLLKKKTKLICTVALLVLICTSQTANAVGPTEHCFGVNHPNLTYPNNFKGWMESIVGINSSGVVSYIHNNLDSLGYYNAYSFSNNKASTVRDSMENDAIFYFNGHGDAGRLITTWYNTATSSWEVTWVTGKATSDSKAYSLEYKYANTTQINLKKYV